MNLKTLDTKHASYDADDWEELYALAEGDKRFKRRISRFLPSHPQEPEELHRQRCRDANYTSYVGAIINLYASWLFSASFSIKASERDTPNVASNLPSFYGQFQENVGEETKLQDFMAQRFKDALTVSKAHWIVELPSDNGAPPLDRAEYDDRRLGHASLRHISCEDLYDWDTAPDGSLLWCIIHTQTTPRQDPRLPRDTVVEQWRLYDPTNVETFELRYKLADGRPKDPLTPIPSITGLQPHGLKRVPLVCFELPTAITVGIQTRGAQIEHFRLDHALSWQIKRTCYSMPVFSLADQENPPRMGAGYYMMLGVDETMTWSAPPSVPFDVLGKNVDKKRDEIYRVTHQMAQSVDNNAETVGRSADSKEIDAAATRIMLDVYGKKMSEAIEETVEMISEARGESDLEWSIEGFTGYDTATVGSLLANATTAKSLGIPSKTFEQEICTKAALALVPELDQRVKDRIREEIHGYLPAITDLTLEEEVATIKADGIVEAETVKSKSTITVAKMKPKPTTTTAPKNAVAPK